MDPRGLSQAARVCPRAGARPSARALVAYLPKLLFLVVIGAVFYGLIKLVGVFFRSIERGRLVFPNFPAEWADPTNKIVRVLLIAFGLVVAFPYLPASDSPAFAGVSVFLGVLVSLSSSTALSNMIAGIVITYTGAFRIGDRVKLGDAFGDISETSLLATRVRTIKNENDYDSQQHRAEHRRDQLLARGQDARLDPAHHRHHRLRRAVAADPRSADRRGAQARQACWRNRRPSSGRRR